MKSTEEESLLKKTTLVGSIMPQKKILLKGKLFAGAVEAFTVGKCKNLLMRG